MANTIHTPVARCQFPSLKSPTKYMHPVCRSSQTQYNLSVMFRRFSRIPFAALTLVGIVGLFRTAVYDSKICSRGGIWDDKHASNLGFWDVLDKSYVDQHVPRPRIGSYQCKDVICSEFLYKRDWVRVGKCLNHMKNSKKHARERNTVHKVRPTLLPACHFMNGTSRGGVALLSFPGSGNTWLRGLLERATGICTGSFYCDGSIWHSGSVGEGITSSNVLVVKSHNVACAWTEQSFNDPDWNQAAILIVRNPFDAIVSYYKWKLFSTGIIKAGDNSHVNQISPNMFKKYSLWETFIKESTPVWAGVIRHMVLKRCSSRPVLVVQYENMKRNRTMEVLRILDFLNMSYSPQEVKQRLLEDVTTFQRHQQTVNIDLYTPEQRKHVRDEVQHIIAKLKQENGGDTLGLEEYLDSD